MGDSSNYAGAYPCFLCFFRSDGKEGRMSHVLVRVSISALRGLVEFRFGSQHMAVGQDKSAPVWSS